MQSNILYTPYNGTPAVRKSTKWTRNYMVLLHILLLFILYKWPMKIGILHTHTHSLYSTIAGHWNSETCSKISFIHNMQAHHARTRTIEIRVSRRSNCVSQADTHRFYTTLNISILLFLDAVHCVHSSQTTTHLACVCVCVCADRSHFRFLC